MGTVNSLSTSHLGVPLNLIARSGDQSISQKLKNPLRFRANGYTSRALANNPTAIAMLIWIIWNPKLKLDACIIGSLEA